MCTSINKLIEQYHSTSSIRDPRLFSHFLVPGYKLTTLSSVGTQQKEKVLMAKLNLGMFITLMDDLADNPRFLNPRLLQHLYLLFPGKVILSTPHLTKQERQTYELGKQLMENIMNNICELPHFKTLYSLFIFDLEQIYRANRYSELMGSLPEMINLKESQEFGHYNMGIVAAGMIDLMGSEDFDLKDLGKARECFLNGQRMGRIGNLISTFSREVEENDLTNEILLSKVDPITYSEKLKQEFTNLGVQITDQKLLSFDTDRYAQGMSELYDLHMRLLGII